LSGGSNVPDISDASLDWPRGGFDFSAEGVFDGVTWRRIFAFCIDFAIVGALAGMLWMLVFLTFGLLSGILFVLPFLPVAYHTLTIAGRRSATIGMQFMGVEVRSQSGERPALLQAFAMSALFYLSVAVTSMLILIVGLFNDRGRCAHDILSGTMVVNSDPGL